MTPHKDKLNDAIEDSVSKGWTFSKLVKPSHIGLFSYTPAHYEYQEATTLEKVYELVSEGWSLDQNSGDIALNIVLKMYEPERKVD